MEKTIIFCLTFLSRDLTKLDKCIRDIADIAYQIYIINATNNIDLSNYRKKYNAQIIEAENLFDANFKLKEVRNSSQGTHFFAITISNNSNKYELTIDRMQSQNKDTSNSDELTEEIDIDKIIPLTLNEENPLISASMIVKNEEKFLPGCLESLRGVIDELIIVDTGSTDRTIEIAEKYGAKVHNIEWKDDFAYARNESLKHCTGKWVLYLDADERLKKETSPYLRKMAVNATEDIGAFIIIIESKHLTKAGDISNQRSGYPRFFRNYGYPTIAFTGRIHEQISYSINELNKTIAMSDVVIHHLGYNATPEVISNKIVRNYTLLIEEIKDSPQDPNAWYHLGQTLGLMNLEKESEDAFKMAVSLGTLKDSVLCSAYAILGQFALQRGNLEEALNYYEASLEKVPEQQGTSYSKALIHLQLGQPELALELIENIKKVQENNKTRISAGFDVDIPQEHLDALEQKCHELINSKG